MITAGIQKVFNADVLKMHHDHIPTRKRCLFLFLFFGFQQLVSRLVRLCLSKVNCTPQQMSVRGPSRYQESWSHCEWGFLPPNRFMYPEISNVVSIMQLLPTGHTLDLLAIVRSIPTSKYDRKVFPAAILRGCAKTTALVFSTGKVVVVTATSPQMGRFACHVYRLILEDIPMLCRDPETDKVISAPRIGRLLFGQWQVKNIVASAFLGCRIKVAQYARDNNLNYRPDVFSGLMTHVDYTDNTTGRVHKIRCLLFDTGHTVVFSSPRIEITNQVFFQFRKIIRDHYQDTSGPIAPNQRQKYRMQALFGPPSDAPSIGLGSVSTITRPTKRRRKAHVTGGIATNDAATLLSQADELGMTPLMRSAISGNTHNVQTWLAVGENPADQTTDGRTAYDLIRGLEGENYDNIRAFLYVEKN